MLDNVLINEDEFGNHKKMQKIPQAKHLSTKEVLMENKTTYISNKKETIETTATFNNERGF